MIKIKTTSREFEVNKTILQNHSGYFKALFQHETLKENLFSIVDLSESIVSGEALSCLLQYMKTGSVNVTIDDLDDVISAIDYLHVDNIQDLLYLNVWQDIDGTNFVNIWKIAKKYGLKEYETLVEQIISKEFCLDFVRQYLFQVEQMDLNDMVYILHVSQGLPLEKLTSELEVFRIAVLWLDARDLDLESRKHRAFELLTKCVHFHLIPLRQFTGEVWPMLDAYEDNRLLEYAEAKQTYHLHPIHQAIHSDRHGDLRFAKDVLVRPCPRLWNAGGVGCGIEAFDWKCGQWKSTQCHVNPNITPRSATGSLDNFLYVAGGIEQGSEVDISSPTTSHSVYRFNPRTNTWIEVTSMLTARADFTLVPFKNDMYAIGGSSSSHQTNPLKPLDSVECYKPFSNLWKPSGQLAKPILNGKGAAIDNMIYVMDNQGNLQRYSPMEDKCELVTRLHQCRKVHAVLPWRGKPHILLSEVGCQMSCVHLYQCGDLDGQMQHTVQQAGKPLQLVAPCFRLNTVNEDVFAFISPEGISMITSSGTYLWKGQTWTKLLFTGKTCLDHWNLVGVCPLQVCRVRLPQNLINLN